MNYQKIYNNLVRNAKLKNRKKLKRDDINYVYYENHHVIPRCLGGLNNKENLVLLTAREHFVAHKLLAEIYPKNNKIFYGYYLMSTNINGGKNKERKYKINSKEFERLRKEHSKYSSEINIGRKLSEVWKENISKGGKGHSVSKKTRNKISIANSGKIRSDEVREKLKNKFKPEGTNEKISKTLKAYYKNELVLKEVTKRNRDYWKNKETVEKHKKSQNKRWEREEEKIKVSNSLKEYYKTHVGGWKGHKHSEESKQKMKKKYICPHCGKIGVGNSMKRWHFDNCKLKTLFNER